MLFRRPRFESLEHRHLLTADGLNAAPAASPLTTVVVSEVQSLTEEQSTEAITESDPSDQDSSNLLGLLRYQSNGSLILSNENGTQPVQQHWPDSTMPANWSPEIAADFSGDGRIDLLGYAQKNLAAEHELPESNANEDTTDGSQDLGLWLHLNDGDAFYLLPWKGSLPFGTQVVGTGDVNGDGLTDVISFDDQTNEVWVSINDQNFGFRSELWARFSEPIHSKLFVGDFDRDGATDVLAGGRAGRWLLAASHQTRFRIQDWGPYAVFDWEEIVTGDFDGDANTDFAARAPDRTWWVWTGSETGIRPAEYWGHWKMGTGWTDVKVADLNADGLDDILGRSAEGTLHVATAVGESDENVTRSEFHSWRWSTGWVARAEWRNTILRDVTGDGLLDHVGQAKDGTWWVGENLGRNFANYFLDRTPLGVTVDFAVDAAYAPATFTSEMTMLSHFPVGSGNATQDSVTQDKTSDFATLAPLRVSLNSSDQLVVEGNGHRVRAIEFRSASGSLIPLPSIESNSFSDLLKNDQLSIRLATTESVIIDGSLTLGVKWDRSTNAHDLEVIYDVVDLPAVVDSSTFVQPNDQTLTTAEHYQALFKDAFSSLPFAGDAVQQVESRDDDGVSVEPDATNNSEQPAGSSDDDDQVEQQVPDTDSDPPLVSLVLDAQNQFVLSTLETPVYALRIESPTSSLLPGASPHPFDELIVSDSGLVVYASESPVMVESEILDLSWQHEQLTDQVIAEFGVGSAEWMPISLFGSRVSESTVTDPSTVGQVPVDVEPAEIEPVDNAVSEETSGAVVIRLDDANRFVVSSTDRSLLGLNFLSSQGGLVPGTSPAPFELFVSNTPRMITLGTFGRRVTFDGDVTLDVGWNTEHPLDNLVIEIGDTTGDLLTTHWTGAQFASQR